MFPNSNFYVKRRFLAFIGYVVMINFFMGTDISSIIFDNLPRLLSVIKVVCGVISPAANSSGRRATRSPFGRGGRDRQWVLSR